MRDTANAVADVQSQNPVAFQVDEDQFGEDPSLSCRSWCISLSQTDNPRVHLRFAELQNAAQLDPDYHTLADFIQNGFPRSSRRLPPALAPFWNGREHLTVDHGIFLKGRTALSFLRLCVLPSSKIFMQPTKALFALKHVRARSSIGPA